MVEVPIRHNSDAARFEAIVDGLLCEASYALDGSVMRMHHTGVPDRLAGRGIAAAMVAAALAHARENGLRVQPDCSYVAAYMARHPESADLRHR